ncbi:MAG: asparaginase [Lachnospira sp.]|nr:asparaginase [Lachnospira sp.]
MKVYTIFTGGTIGSRIDEKKGITTKHSSPYNLLNLYEDKYHSGIEFVTEEPYYILSENLSSMHIKKLVQSVLRGLEEKDIDGIVITHGTDTLPYTAALLAYLFGNARIPILLVSSDYPLSDERANGLCNFRYALEFIKGGYGSGVFVCYCNQGDYPVIHRGTRLLKHLPYSADVISVAGSWYGRFENNRYISNPGYRVREREKAMFQHAEEVKLKNVSDEIMRITPYVGMPYIKPSKHTKAVLHESFHSGTIAISEGLKTFMEEANRLNIPVYLTGLSETETEYETVGQYRTLGIRPLNESAPIAQYCKLWLAVSNGINPDEIMNCSVAEDWV